jgi:hypothetical protein
MYLLDPKLRAQFTKAGNHLCVTVSFQRLQVCLHDVPATAMSQQAAQAADAECINHRLLA